MRAPYQIKRKPLDAEAMGAVKIWLFELVDTRSGRVIAHRSGKSPIAPQELRDYQARLNTRAMLD